MSVEVLKQIWPEWSIGKRIGGGAYGTVYEASRNEYGVDNHAAIKIISIPASEAEIDTLRSEGLDVQATKTHFQTIVNDFVNEIRVMISLEGRPNIVNVRDYKVVEKKDEFGWYIFILMELLTPFAVHTCDHEMTETEVIKLGCDICTALETCAEEKIIHRDIKPGNILVHKSGTFKLGDFGIARKLENMTGGLSQRYTPKYMAPEVATSMYYDERVDIYSLGIVLYELLNGRRIPFQPNKQIYSLDDNENAVRRRNSGEALTAPCDASPAMADLILRACAYDPNMRFASATDMKQALMSVANGTYQMAAENGLDRTTSVRRAPAHYGRTTSVCQAPAASGQRINTFGTAPKEKSKMPAVIAAVLTVVLLVGAGIFAVPKFLDGDDSADSSETPGESTSETADYSSFDEEKIDSFIAEADTLAADGNYEGALIKIQTALVTYPKSEALQKKEKDYSDALDEQLAVSASAAASSPQESAASEPITQEPSTTVPAPHESAIPEPITPEPITPEPITPEPIIPETPTDIQPIMNVTNSAIMDVGTSSFLSEPNFGIYHTADRVLDGQLDTAWVEGSSSDGIGDFLTFQLDGTYLVSGLTIHAGYHKNESLYYKNSRPQEIQITFSDGSYFCCILYDVMQAQTICFDRSVVTDSITMEIVSVYHGSAYDDTAITEVSLF